MFNAPSIHINRTIGNDTESRFLFYFETNKIYFSVILSLIESDTGGLFYRFVYVAIKSNSKF